MKRYIYRFFVISFAISLVLPLGGCSLFGKGKKQGEEQGLAEGEIDNRFGSGNIPGAEGDGMFKDVLFDYDSTSIGDAARQSIEFNLQVLQSNPNLTIKLEGHCDERGTQEYNLALGAERAKAVMEVLASYGVSRSRLSTISYGEEIPLDTGHDESAFARNRRVHFAVASGGAGAGGE